MKRPITTLMWATLLVMAVACEEKMPGVIDSLIFNDQGDWLVRDTDDPYEWVDGQCCNDLIPYPLSMGAELSPLLQPEEDLDYYRITVEEGQTGKLTLWTNDDSFSPEDSIYLRIFSPTLSEFEDVWLDKRPFTTGGLRLWTVLAGPLEEFIVMVSGEFSGDRLQYQLAWERADTSNQLDLRAIQALSIGLQPLDRGSEYSIDWDDNLSGGGAISIALMKGPVIKELILDEYFSPITNSPWLVSFDLEGGVDYRLLIFRTFNPTTMDISDAFEIR